MNRRDFLKLTASTAAAGMAGCATNPTVTPWTGTDRIKAVLLHLGHNMWCEWLPDDVMKTAEIREKFRPNLNLRNRDEQWRRVTARMAERKLNMLVIDIGEGLVYPSHPELAIEGSWSPDKLRDEIIRLRGMGIEAIPKLNFSATHDGWLKDYHRMLTLPKYYEVVKDVIRDVAEIFQTPRFFHLGYDEETIHNQRASHFAVVRQGELWWHDFLWFNETVKKTGSRSWIWSDYGWRHKEEFLARMPRDVLQSNWYYYHIDGEQDKEHLERIAFFDELDKAGFDQIPCGSAYSWKPNFTELVRYCRKHLTVSPRLKGFLLAPWTRTWNRFHDKNAYALEAFEMGKTSVK